MYGISAPIKGIKSSWIALPYFVDLLLLLLLEPVATRPASLEKRFPINFVHLFDRPTLDPLYAWSITAQQ